MNTVQIILTCPNCGNFTFVETEDCAFECLACGNVSFPEDMCSETKEVKL